MRHLLLLVVLALLAAGCTVEDDVTLPTPAPDTATPAPTVQPDIIEGEPVPNDAPVAPTPAPQPTPIAEPAGRAELPEGFEFAEGARLAFQDNDGQLFTALSTGENLAPLTNPDEGLVHSLPVWAPDGSRISWVTTAEDNSQAQVRTARIDGSAWFEYATETPPFYVQWDPTSTQVAMLSAGSLGFNLSVVDIALGVPEQDLDSGSPFWFSWSSDADSMLVHASGLRLDMVPIDGSPQALQGVPAQFQAPAWIDSQQPLMYADLVDGEQFLVNAGLLGVGRRPLISYEGYLQFTVNEEAGFIALQSIDASLAPVPEVITASYQQDDFVDVVDPINQNQLVIMALFGGDPFVIEDQAAAGFFWSPDGSRLAYLLEVEPGDGDCASSTAVYELVVWESASGEYFVGPDITLSADFACNYLPFFDQDAQAHSYWSPDSTEFVFAGTVVSTGETGIFTAEPSGFGIDTTLIADGVYATFAPPPGAGGGNDCVGADCDA